MAIYITIGMVVVSPEKLFQPESKEERKGRGTGGRQGERRGATSSLSFSY